VLGSATGMDKSAMKQLFAAAGLPQTPHVNLLRSEWKADAKRSTKLIEKNLTYPVFVKPANLGSSVGISKVHDRSELAPAMDLAAGYDRKLIIEQGVGGPGAKPRELEVAVLGNDSPIASVVGEIVPGAEFYDYNAKYHSAASLPIIPAILSESESRQIRKMAIAAFRACDCAGLARVDFLMEPAVKARKNKKPTPARIYLNEINTMPGFTSISMYPKLWEASGIPYKQLIDRLITLAAERHREKQQTTFTRV
ncbi:MAG TPA: D-alanine--D-alanine ligase family protein, partial [Edaphobacter sp.]|nr:D-alanine--D-alanine ligase family protein [Edaphobacter sp.]